MEQTNNKKQEKKTKIVEEFKKLFDEYDYDLDDLDEIWKILMFEKVSNEVKNGFRSSDINHTEMYHWLENMDNI